MLQPAEVVTHSDLSNCSYIEQGGSNILEFNTTWALQRME